MHGMAWDGIDSTRKVGQTPTGLQNSMQSPHLFSRDEYTAFPCRKHNKT